MNPILSLGTAFDQLNTDVSTLVAYVIFIVLSALVARLLNTAHKRWNIAIPDSLQTTLDGLIERGAGSAVHHGMPLVEGLEQKIPDKAATDHIVQWILDTTDDKKIVAMGKEQIAKHVGAWLGVQTMNATPTTAAAPAPASDAPKTTP